MIHCILLVFAYKYFSRRHSCNKNLFFVAYPTYT